MRDAGGPSGVPDGRVGAGSELSDELAAGRDHFSHSGASASGASSAPDGPPWAGPGGGPGGPGSPSTTALSPASPARSIGWALLRPLAILAAGVLLAIIAHGVWVLILVLAFVAMVMLHELGHFATAKWSGMKVTEFFFGFGPRLWSVRRGETEYGVKILPAGGYVRITGMTMLEEVDPSDEQRSYRQATFPRRVLVASAGSLVHAILAFLLIFAALVFVGEPQVTGVGVAGLYPFAHQVSPAQHAGFKAGDVFVSIDGHAVHNDNQVSALIRTAVGKRLHVVVRRDGHLVHLVVTPVNGNKVKTTSNGHEVPIQVPKKTPGIIGVSLVDVTSSATAGPITAIGNSGTLFGRLVGETFQGLGEIFSLHGLSAFAHQVVTASNHHAASGSSGSGSSSGSNSAQVTSILGVIQIGSQLHGDIFDLLWLLAAVNLFIGVVNLFPMLPLDGGHVAIAVYERIRSRRGRRYHADVMKLLPVAYVFLAFIVLIGIGALYSNIVNPVHLPGG